MKTESKSKRRSARGKSGTESPKRASNKADVGPRQQAEVLTALKETLLDITKGLSLPELLHAIVERAVKLLNASGGGMYLNEAEERRVRCVVSYHTLRDYSGTVLAYGEGAAGRVAESGEPLLIEDYGTWSGRAATYEEERPFRAVVCTPMKWKGQVTGAITVLRDKKFTRKELNLLTRFADHAAVAVENARLVRSAEQELNERKHAEEALRENEKRAYELSNIAQRQAQELSLLDKVRTAIAHELELPVLLCRVVESISETFGYTLVSLYLLEGDELILQHQVGYERTISRIALTQGIAGRVASSGKAVFLPDVTSDTDFLAAISGILSEICIPFFDNGKVAGILNVESRGIRLTEADVNLMSALSEQIGMAIGKARLYGDVQRRNQLLSALQESTLALMQQTDLPKTLQTIMTQAAQLVNTVHGYIYLVQPDENMLQEILGMGIFEKYEGLKLKPNEGLAGKIWRTARPLNVREYIEWEGKSGQFNDTAFHAVVGVPLIYDERVIGVLGLAHLDSERTFSDNDLEILSYFSRLASIALENANLFTRVNQELAERKQAEKSLRQVETKYRDLVERLPLVVYTADIGINGAWSYVSPNIQNLLGFSAEEWVADPGLWYRQIHPQDRDAQQVLEERALANNNPVFESEYRIFTKDGRQVWVRDSGIILLSENNKPPIVQGVLMDVTERREMQDAFRRSELFARSIIENEPECVKIVGAGGILQYMNPAGLAMIEVPDLEMVRGQSVYPIIVPEHREAFQDLTERVLHGETGSLQFEIVGIKGTRRWLDTHAVPLFDKDENVESLLGITRDITDHKQNEQRIDNQLKRLNALHAIDNAINSNFDLRITLEVMLKEVTNQLNVDAACVLLFNKDTHTLDYTAGRGFLSRATQHTKLGVGEGFAGRVLLERKTIHVPNLVKTGNRLTEALSLAGENFVAYVGSPLIAKGQVMGVLEIFQRSPLAPDPDWFDFLSMLTDQAAIAIDNARLFENLQRSNFGLILAYDATIEGWSRALDLRDRETEGHTQRVTELTIKLALQMGIPDTDIPHIRRGALLHDIGKMGIPDSILHKPDKLTPEEWAIMRQHTQHAYQMLAPINYLRPALDIPRYHHEKWDGTGYPDGLKGEQIPIAARIFAVVDVWDALTNVRPYRQTAWSKEKTIEYIRSESGKHFDPTVVNAFLGITSLD